jgi:hypothetical protein
MITTMPSCLTAYASAMASRSSASAMCEVRTLPALNVAVDAASGRSYFSLSADRVARWLAAKALRFASRSTGPATGLSTTRDFVLGSGEDTAAPPMDRPAPPSVLRLQQALDMLAEYVAPDYVRRARELLRLGEDRAPVFEPLPSAEPAAVGEKVRESAAQRRSASPHPRLHSPRSPSSTAPAPSPSRRSLARSKRRRRREASDALCAITRRLVCAGKDD